ncbi:MAG: heparan-alpha-glucosaminide N-acetyltransferase [archaeon]|nr:heparan-alpha-glucosaminide N-acetyltransferase [archaeon]
MTDDKLPATVANNRKIISHKTPIYTMKTRFFEIDALRGIAIILMVFYHILYDLYYFTGLDINLWSGPLWLIGRVSAAIFIFLVGISLTISFSRIKTRLPQKDILNKYFSRGLKIFCWGLLITAMTHIFLDEGTIYFGILHFIGLSIILAYPFLKLKRANLILGAGIIMLGTYLKGFTFNTPHLLFLGIRPESFYTLDYFPIFPWFGVVLFGIFLGNTLYQDGKRMFHIPNLKRQSGPLCILGRNSLLIYLLHQPILIAIICLLTGSIPA